jgi:hypothetical protein
MTAWIGQATLDHPMYRLFPLAVTALALFATGACAQGRPQTYILAGQSNMSGRGLIDDLTPTERAADPTIRLYGNDGRWRVAAEPLDAAQDQVDAVSEDRIAAVGPGLFFARALRAGGGGPVALVPCAKGGSSIGRWKPGGGRETLYGSCLARAREAGGGIAGLVWYQGETDAEKTDAGPAWRTAFEALVKSLRHDLGGERLPIVLVQLADAPAQKPGDKPYPSWTAIQAAQAAPVDACVAMVSAKGLGKREDDLHLTTAAQRVLGAKLAEAMRGLQDRGCE